MEKLREILFLKSCKGIGKAAIYNRYLEDLKQVKQLEDLIKIVSDKESKLSEADIDKAVIDSGLLYEKLVADNTITPITFLDEKYPENLNVMQEKRPLILYVKGNVDALYKENIAVVGTRKPSIWSQRVEERLVSKILEISDKVVVSGLALGCDKIAHETTVKEKRVTIAVLPSGVNVITPASHKALAKEILENNGCLISEYEPDAKAFKTTFVERDAIVAALSNITFVVECDEKSGTMHTVDAAQKYKRVLACFWPDDFEKGSYGGNKLMAEKKGAFKIDNTDALVELFTKKISHEDEKSGAMQLSFEDILKVDSGT